LGNFWLKIEQFWPFEEIYIFSHGGHLGYRTALTDNEIKKNSSPLKLLCQSQPNFAEMIIGWPPFKIVSLVDFDIYIYIYISVAWSHVINTGSVLYTLFTLPSSPFITASTLYRRACAKR
jgi:hypothetical protein